MLSVRAKSAQQANRPIYDEDRLVDRIGTMVVHEKTTNGLDRSLSGRLQQQPQRPEKVFDCDDDVLTTNKCSRRNKNLLDKEVDHEINKELDGDRCRQQQLQPFNVLHRSSSVSCMGRPRMMPSFDSERNLTAREAKGSWCNMDSVHSRASVFDDFRKRKDLDSAHISLESTAGESSKKGDNNVSNSDFNDSSCSFASFGMSSNNDDGDDDEDYQNDLAAIISASKAFTGLQEEPTPRAVLMKQHSMRLNRKASYRGSLSLIQENNLG